MHIRYLILIILIAVSGNARAQVQEADFTIAPAVFGPDDTITVTVSGIETNQWGVTDVYLWAWSYDEDDENPRDAPGNGTWTSSGDTHKMQNKKEGTFSITIVPSDFFDRKGIGRIGMLAKAKNGNGDKKTQDFLVEVGRFQIRLTSPAHSPSILDSAGNFPIRARSSQQAYFTLIANGDPIVESDHQDTVFSYEYDLQENTHFILQAENGTELLTEEFSAVIRPQTEIASMPGYYPDGIHPHMPDTNSLILVLYAPGKEWVHVMGNFNDWQIDDAYLMKRDTALDRFWIILTNMNWGTDLLFQYLVEFTIPIADPYSTTILDPYHDAFMDSILWPDLPDYPIGKTTEAVTWVRNTATDFEWQNNGFVPPTREELVIYELLIRDFDEKHSFDAVRERLDYLQELGVNAIELMPISEFDGNESWGYNPSFHSALDKYYGSPEAFKKLVDECHSRGMAVILDVVYNHASGQNPYVRLWNDCNGCLTGNPTADNPFFNVKAPHAYSVFHDFNHQSQATRDYVKRSVEYWIREYRIDGFRWDLTKGFTQNCGSGNQEICTNTYQADRVEVLKTYADIQWNQNPEFLVIFEHLGVGSSADEEVDWANYRLDENYGILLWNNLNHPYSEAAMGYHDNHKSDLAKVYGPNRNLPVGSTISYMESHDEERLMYKMLEYGNGSGNYQIQNNATALNRLKLASAFFLTIPGPKMIWQFGELGYPYSINYNGRTGNKPIHWEYAQDPERVKVYKTYQALLTLRQSSPAFTSPESTVQTRLQNAIKHITIQHPHADVVLTGNFDVNPQEATFKFTQSGKWYAYFSGDSISISDLDTMMVLNPGEFRLYTTKKFETPDVDILTHSRHEEIAVIDQIRPTLYTNSPNPFNRFTRITYHLPASAEVLLEIYEVTGRRISTLVNQVQSAGIYEVDFSADELRPGVYFYRLVAGGYSTIEKMIRQ